MARARILIGLCAALVTLALLDWSALTRAFAQLSGSVLTMSAALSVVTTLLLALRWSVLAGPPGIVPGRAEFRDALIAQVFNLVTPAAAGADAYRVVVGVDRAGGRGRAAGLVVLERILGVAGYSLSFLICYALAGAVGKAGLMFAAPAPIFAILAALPLVAMLFARLLAAHIHRWSRASRHATIKAMLSAAAGISSGRAAVTFALSLLAAGTWLGYAAVLAAATGVGLDQPVVGMIAIVTDFARLLPIAIQGIGVREATFAFLAAQAGGSSEAAFAACATAYALHYALVVVIVLVARYGLSALPRIASGIRQTVDQSCRGLR
jgi:glycosyltransferase 2 family protein